MTLVHGHNLHEERTKQMEEINEPKPEEIHVKTTMKLTERAENIPKAEGINQEVESTGIAIGNEIKVSAAQTSTVGHKKELVNLGSTEMGQELSAETAESLIKENHKERAERQVTPKSATETAVLPAIE